MFNAVGTIIRQNVIAGNTGTGIRLGQATMTLIVGNTIGLDAAGTVARPNNVGGILVGDGNLVNASTNNTIGGTTAADRNVISGHAPNDIAIFIQAFSNGNKVFGNYIGTNAAGTAAIPNGIGIEIFNSTGNVIGAVGSGRNVISGNDDDGNLIKRYRCTRQQPDRWELHRASSRWHNTAWEWRGLGSLSGTPESN